MTSCAGFSLHNRRILDLLHTKKNPGICSRWTILSLRIRTGPLKNMPVFVFLPQRMHRSFMMIPVSSVRSYRSTRTPQIQFVPSVIITSDFCSLTQQILKPALLVQCKKVLLLSLASFFQNVYFISKDKLQLIFQSIMSGVQNETEQYI